MASPLKLSDLTPELLETNPRAWWRVVLKNIEAQGDELPVYCDGCKKCSLVQYENLAKCSVSGCKATACDYCKDKLFPRGKEEEPKCNSCIREEEEERAREELEEKKYKADLRKLTPEQKEYLVSQIKQGARDVFAIYCPVCDEIVMENGDDITACSKCDLQTCSECPEPFSKWKESSLIDPVCDKCFVDE